MMVCCFKGRRFSGLECFKDNKECEIWRVFNCTDYDALESIMEYVVQLILDFATYGTLRLKICDKAREV